MKIVSVLALGFMAMHPSVIASVYAYAFPNELYEGSKSTTLLLLISVLLIALAVLSIFIPQKQETKRNKVNLKLRWPIFFSGWLALFFGWFVTCLFWYAPPTYLGYTEPAPATGVICLIIFNSISAVIFYFSSSLSSEKRPNLMRILVLLSSVFGGAFIALTLSLVLLYSFPSKPELVAYPSAATYCFLTYVVWGILIFQMNRERIKKTS